MPRDIEEKIRYICWSGSRKSHKECLGTWAGPGQESNRSSTWIRLQSEIFVSEADSRVAQRNPYWWLWFWMVRCVCVCVCHQATAKRTDRQTYTHREQHNAEQRASVFSVGQGRVAGQPAALAVTSHWPLTRPPRAEWAWLSAHLSQPALFIIVRAGVIDVHRWQHTVPFCWLEIAYNSSSCSCRAPLIGVCYPCLNPLRSNGRQNGRRRQPRYGIHHSIIHLCIDWSTGIDFHRYITWACDCRCAVLLWMRGRAIYCRDLTSGFTNRPCNAPATPSINYRQRITDVLYFVALYRWVRVKS